MFESDIELAICLGGGGKNNGHPPPPMSITVAFPPCGAIRSPNTSFIRVLCEDFIWASFSCTSSIILSSFSMAFVCLAARKAFRAAFDIGNGADMERMGGGEFMEIDSLDVVRLLVNAVFLGVAPLVAVGAVDTVLFAGLTSFTLGGMVV